MRKSIAPLPASAGTNLWQPLALISSRDRLAETFPGIVHQATILDGRTR
jgi:hypothetical protein